MDQDEDLYRQDISSCHMGEDRMRERMTKRGGVEQNIEMTERGRNMVWCGVWYDTLQGWNGVGSGVTPFL